MKNLLLPLLLLGMQLSAQDKTLLNYQPSDFERGVEQIYGLRFGALVVKLNTRDKTIRAYREAGKRKLADKLRVQTDTFNVELMRAFRRQYTFSHVYFIRADRARDFVNGERHHIFLDENMRVDTTIQFHCDYYLFAEYGTIMKPEQTDEYHYRSYNKTQPSSTPASSSTIFISDTSFRQLQSPFPFFIKLSDFKDLTLDVSYADVIVGKDSLTGKNIYREALVIERNRVRGTFDKPLRKLNAELFRYYINRSSKVYAAGANFDWLRKVFSSSKIDEVQLRMEEEKIFNEKNSDTKP